MENGSGVQKGRGKNQKIPTHLPARRQSFRSSRPAGRKNETERTRTSPAEKKNRRRRGLPANKNTKRHGFPPSGFPPNKNKSDAVFPPQTNRTHPQTRETTAKKSQKEAMAGQKLSRVRCCVQNLKSVTWFRLLSFFVTQVDFGLSFVIFTGSNRMEIQVPPSEKWWQVSRNY